jgi:hypothetical protein
MDPGSRQPHENRTGSTTIGNLNAAQLWKLVGCDLDGLCIDVMPCHIILTLKCLNGWHIGGVEFYDEMVWWLCFGRG